jgi:hypothetical protein|tara:strand:+ start:530 stop:949 length:420 start_codon:yes stop_codon:yes gene_type:complete
MAETEFGIIEGQNGGYGNTGATTQAGVPIKTWDSWSETEKDLFLQDYLRTESQQNYYDDWCVNNPTACASYIYTGYIDLATGGDAAAAADEGGWVDTATDTYDDVVESGKEYVAQTIDFTKDAATIALVAGAFLLLRGK